MLRGWGPGGWNPRCIFSPKSKWTGLASLFPHWCWAAAVPVGWTRLQTCRRWSWWGTRRAEDLYIFCWDRLHKGISTSVVVEQEIEKGGEDKEDVESSWKSLVGGDGERGFSEVIIVFLLEEAVDLSNRVEGHGEQGEVVGGVNDYFELLREGFDLILIIDQLD